MRYPERESKKVLGKRTLGGRSGGGGGGGGGLKTREKM